MRASILVIFAIGFGGCAADVPQSTDVAPGLEQIELEIHNFTVANEFFYAEEGTYAGDLSALETHVEWAFPDSGRGSGVHSRGVIQRRLLVPPGGCRFAEGIRSSVTKKADAGSRHRPDPGGDPTPIL